MTRRAALVLLVLVAAEPSGEGAEVHGAPLPRRARPIGENHYASPMGFRDTVEYYRRELRRRGLKVQLMPVERVREVVYVRILAADRAARFEAVHVVQMQGRTTIYVVPVRAAPGSVLPRAAPRSIRLRLEGHSGIV